MFLEELNIKCGRVRLRKCDGNVSPRYVLSISNLPSIKLFCSEIPFMHPTKRKKVTALLADA